MRTLSALSLFLVLVLAAAPAQAVTTLAAALNGANERPTPGDLDGSGFALVIIDPVAGTVRYALFEQNIGAPTAAHIHRGTADEAGPVVINFNPSFSNGVAIGNVATGNLALLEEIIASPGEFYVNIHNAEFPGGAIRGQLVAAASDATDAVFPVVGRVAGSNNTFFRTDIALLNRSGEDTSVVFEYYPSGPSGNTGPSRVISVNVDNNEQRLLAGDVLQNLLGAADGTGALRILAPRNVTALARIYNDQRASDGGTFSQFIPAQPGSQNRTNCALPMLASTNDYRTNIGWFNLGDDPVTATFRAHHADGSELANVVRTIAPRAQEQTPLTSMFPAAAGHDDVYVTFTTTGGSLYGYASVVDNVNGDAIFIPCQ